jgi:hypothetical protein
MEITGETSPLALRTAAEFGALTPDKPHVNLYTWSLGLNGKTMDWLDRLEEEDAVLVQLIVENRRSRYTSREIFATLEYLPPTRTLVEEPSFLEWCKRAFAAGSHLAESTGVPGAKVVGALTTTIANIIPSRTEKGSRWFLQKFDFPVESSVNEHTYGVEWHISRAAIREVGSRLVGRLGVVFLDAPIQGTKPSHSEKDSVVTIRGRFGLKQKPDRKSWYDFSMLPPWNSNDLVLKVNPQKFGKSEPES